MTQYTLMATAAAGIEGLVANELKALGYQVNTENGRVRFKGNDEDIARTNLWLRTADRIKIIFGEFDATTFDQLFKQTKALPWEELLPMDAQFPVQGRSIKSQLHAVPSVQAIVKKAISQRLQTYYHRRGHLPETGAIYPLEVEIRKNHVMITADTSGSSLFKRGYRKHKGLAPLKENMAAALIQLTTWHPDRPLYDPTCGSGTIAIEAALIGHNIAPGLYRDFACEKWDFFDSQVFKNLRKTARQVINMDIQLNILACDRDHRMIEIAKENADQAGVLESIEFKQMQVADYVPKCDYGILIANPPYGDRQNDTDYVHNLYTQMGAIYNQMPTWSKYILTSDEAFEEYYGRKATKKRKLYNGAIKVTYYQFWSEK